MTHTGVGKLTITGSDIGLSPGRRQAIIWTSAGILLIGPLETNLSGIVKGIQTFTFKKVFLILASPKWRPFCIGLNLLKRGMLVSTLVYIISPIILLLIPYSVFRQY